jgi:hypothetical protein
VFASSSDRRSVLPQSINAPKIFFLQSTQNPTSATDLESDNAGTALMSCLGASTQSKGKQSMKISNLVAVAVLCGGFSVGLFAQSNSNISGSLYDNTQAQQVINIAAGTNAQSSTGGIYVEKSDVSATIRTNTEANQSIGIAAGNGATAQFGGFKAKNSSVSGTVSDNTVVQQTIAIAAGAGASASAGGVSMENTHFSGNASSNTVASQTILIAAGQNAVASAGGIHSK